MAYGLPDYYRGMDIAYQALAELVVRPQNIPQTDVDVTAQTLGQIINRPKYGGAVLSAGSAGVWANSSRKLVGIDGKGMVYGGSVWLDASGSQSNSQVLMVLDDGLIEGLSFVRLKDYGVVNPRSAVISLNVFDGENYIYSVGISYGLTFETGLDLWYKEEHGLAPTVHYRIIYALI